MFFLSLALYLILGYLLLVAVYFAMTLKKNKVYESEIVDEGYPQLWNATELGRQYEAYVENGYRHPNSNQTDLNKPRLSITM